MSAVRARSGARTVTDPSGCTIMLIVLRRERINSNAILPSSVSTSFTVIIHHEHTTKPYVGAVRNGSEAAEPPYMDIGSLHDGGNSTGVLAFTAVSAICTLNTPWNFNGS